MIGYENIERNIKLVGELIRHKMIASRIAVCICQDLLCEGKENLEARLETLVIIFKLA